MQRGNGGLKGGYSGAAEERCSGVTFGISAALIWSTVFLCGGEGASFVASAPGVCYCSDGFTPSRMHMVSVSGYGISNGALRELCFCLFRAASTDVSDGHFCWQLRMIETAFLFSVLRPLQMESLRGLGWSGFCCCSHTSFRASPSSMDRQILLLLHLLHICMISWCLFCTKYLVCLWAIFGL